MLKDIVSVEAMEPYRLRLVFEDGVTGEVDLERLVRFEGVFAPLRDPASFRAVRVDPEAGTIVWPNGADLDPDMLYAEVTGVPVAARLGEPGADGAGRELGAVEVEEAGADVVWEAEHGPARLNERAAMSSAAPRGLMT